MATKKKPAKTTRTRTEVVEEFDSIRAEVRDRPPADPKAAGAAREHAAAVAAAVSGKTQAVVKELAEVKIEMGRELDRVAEQYLARLEELGTLNEAIALAREELANYHKLDVAATALDQMVADYEARKKALEEEVAAARAEWEREGREHEQRVRDTRAEEERVRQREAEQYDYSKGLDRKKQEDSFTYQMAERQRQLKDEEERQRKEWAEREAKLKAQEDEVAKLRADAAAYPERIKAEVDKAERILGAVLKKDHAHEMALAKKEAEGTSSLLSSELKGAQQTIAQQAKQIENLTAQLESARKQVAEISVQAVQASAGKQAADMAREIAMAQAVGTGSQKKS
jgi:colicin import membrane protein